MKSSILTTLSVGPEPDGHVYVIVPDNEAGKSNVFTVYALPGSPSRPVKVIGRELPMGTAEEVVRKDEKRRKTLARRAAGT